MSSMLTKTLMTSALANFNVEALHCNGVPDYNAEELGLAKTKGIDKENKKWLATYNLSFALQADLNFGSEAWLIEYSRNHPDMQSDDMLEFAKQWGIGGNTKNAMDSLRQYGADKTPPSVLALQEANDINSKDTNGFLKGKDFDASSKSQTKIFSPFNGQVCPEFDSDSKTFGPKIEKPEGSSYRILGSGFGATANAISYLDSKYGSANPSAMKQILGKAKDSENSNINIYKFPNRMTYVETTHLYGPGAIAAMAFDREQMGEDFVYLTEGESLSKDAQEGFVQDNKRYVEVNSDLVKGRPFLALYFPKAHAVVVSVHLPRFPINVGKEGAIELFNMCKTNIEHEVHQALLMRKDSIELMSANVVVLGDFNDEQHSVPVNFDFLSFHMQGVRRGPAPESWDGKYKGNDDCLQPTACYPDITKDKDGKEVSDYSRGGLKLNGINDLIYHSKNFYGFSGKRITTPKIATLGSPREAFLVAAKSTEYGHIAEELWELYDYPTLYSEYKSIFDKMPLPGSDHAAVVMFWEEKERSSSTDCFGFLAGCM